jgi:hypothetical protein
MRSAAAHKAEEKRHWQESQRHIEKAKGPDAAKHQGL